MPSPLYAFHYGHLSFTLKQGHRYPLPRYAWLRQRVLDSGLFYPQRVVAGQPVGDAVLLLGHSAEYLQKMTTGDLTHSELRLLNLPWSERVVSRASCIVGATQAAAERALLDGISFVLGGGTHHAHADYGSGFCVFNDIACVAQGMVSDHGLGRIAVLDCDVHQGDGTATILADCGPIFTCSIHAKSNFPFTKASSDLDIGLATGTGDVGYMAAVERGLAAVLAHGPELIFYVAGADPFVDDRLGKLAVSAETLAARDQIIMQTCIDRAVPLVVTLGGGYTDPIVQTVNLNMRTIEIGVDVFNQHK